MRVIHSDNHILIVEKPAGIEVQPQLCDEAKAWVKEKYAKPGAVFLEPIHRLDKPVSGLVLFARTSKALTRLNEAMRQRKIRKFYLARVEGKVDEGTLEDYLMHGSFRAEVVAKDHPEAKEARLSYRALSHDKDTTLVEIELHTGRYHQIRVQFGHRGHPIVGDEKYGSRIASKKIALHHHKLMVTHPVTTAELVFESPCAL